MEAHFSPRRHLPLCTALAVLLLSGCASQQVAKPLESVRMVEADRAMILPPPGSHSVSGVIEKTAGNLTEQRVLLATNSNVPGQNYLNIRLYGSTPAGEGGSHRGLSAPGLQREAYNATNGVASQPSALFMQNSYGPFGFASGKGPSGDHCIYGWQQIRSPENQRSSLGNLGVVDIRARLCDRQAGENELLKTMLGYTVTGAYGSAAWNPYGAPRSAEAVLAGTARPASAAFSPSIPTAPVAAPHPARPAAPKPAASPVPDSMVEPVAKGPPVPLPQAATASQRDSSAPKATTTPTVVVPLPTQ
ncbi:cellulose biosynthesis protein BcsN [Allorhizobium undicola]|uniref:cellulose biosynthesis protein BcsN n=1 Tax=Allorhizobium undicola TaxID=78527 RepID=UPI0006880727|nr:cellulose biosynthesis protein BcsN [Allorhizobium undicola]